MKNRERATEQAMDDEIGRTLEALKKRYLQASRVENRKEARGLILDLIPADATVAVGDSSTVRQTEVIKALKARGTRVINPFDHEKKIENEEAFFDLLFRPSIEGSVSDVHLTGTNALTEDGVLLNIDGAGNRVAGMFWGHPLSIIVVGKNKIVRNLDEAFERVKNMVAPEHIRRRGGSTPCTVDGKCHDCSGPKRVCAVTSMIEHKPILTEIHVVIVNEDLGLSWDRGWPEERIRSIAQHHEQFSWSPSHEVLQTINTKQLWEKLRLKRGGLHI
jgi:hypothetical protein